MSPFSLGILGSARVAPAPSGVSDNFNRANGSLGTSTSGHAWSVVAGTWSIASNKATTNTTAEVGYAVVSAGFTDQDVTATIANQGSYPGLLARYVNASNLYRVLYNPGTSAWELRRSIGGADATLATYAGNDLGVARTVSLRVVEGSGTDLAVYIDGTLRITHNDTTSGRPNGTSAGLHKGWYYGGVSSTWDDFTVTEL